MPYVKKFENITDNLRALAKNEDFAAAEKELLAKRSELVKLAGQARFAGELSDMSNQSLIGMTAVLTILYHTAIPGSGEKDDIAWIRGKLHDEAVRRKLNKKLPTELQNEKV